MEQELQKLGKTKSRNSWQRNWLESQVFSNLEFHQGFCLDYPELTTHSSLLKSYENWEWFSFLTSRNISSKRSCWIVPVALQAWYCITHGMLQTHQSNPMKAVDNPRKQIWCVVCRQLTFLKQLQWLKEQMTQSIILWERKWISHTASSVKTAHTEYLAYKYV